MTIRALVLRTGNALGICCCFVVTEKRLQLLFPLCALIAAIKAPATVHTDAATQRSAIAKFFFALACTWYIATSVPAEVPAQKIFVRQDVSRCCLFVPSIFLSAA